MTVRLTKIEDLRFDGKHPNGINVGAERIGTMGSLTIGEPFVLNKGLGWFKTSPVVKTNDDNTFETENSKYKIEFLHD
jgi:hypothetical protein